MRETFPYQEAGADFLAAHPRSGCFDDMGAGKSVTAIRACDKRNAKRIVVICPAAVREHWRHEFQNFQHQYRRIVKGVSIHDYVAWHRGAFDVLVVSFELAAKWSKHFQDHMNVIDALIIDEGHYLKQADTARARAILGAEADGSGIVRWSCACWWLTGTPIPNSPKDIWTFLRTANVMPLNEIAFCKRYFDSRPRTYSTAHTPKQDMIPELQALIGNNSIRRTLAEVGIELPEFHLMTFLVDGDSTDIKNMLLQHPGLDNAIVEALEAGRGLSGLKVEHVATLRRLIGEAKAVPYAAMLAEELHNGLDKAVVIAVHTKTLNDCAVYLNAKGLKATIIDGSTPENQRIEQQRTFKDDADHRVLLGQIKSAGTGLTLVSSCHIDILESDWTPAGNAQALKRVHRIGQNRKVRARFITLANSFDETINEIVADKSAKIAMIEKTA